MQTLQIRDVVADVERKDLPLAIAEQLVAADTAVEDEAAMRGLVAIAHDVLPGSQGVSSHGQALDGLTLLVREGGDALQLADEHGYGALIGG